MLHSSICVPLTTISTLLNYWNHDVYVWPINDKYKTLKTIWGNVVFLSGTMRRRRKITKSRAVQCCIWCSRWEEAADTTFLIYKRQREDIKKLWGPHRKKKKQKKHVYHQVCALEKDKLYVIFSRITWSCDLYNLNKYLIK